MHGEKGKIVVQTPSGEYQKVNYEEFGKQNTGRIEREIGNYKEEEKIEPQESNIQDAASSSASERALGGSERRAEEPGPVPCDSDHRILDRTEDEERDGKETWSESSSSVADEPAGSVWDVRGAFETTKDEEEYDPERRRSEVPEKEDQRIGADDRDARSPYCDSKIDARLSRSRNEGREEDLENRREETWQEAKGTAEDSSWKSESGWFKKEEE